MQMSKFYAWAIDLNGKKHPGLVGRYWWFDGIPNIPPQLEGCRVCLFTTRKIARGYLKKMKKYEEESLGDFIPYPKARVVKVLVGITIQER